VGGQWDGRRGPADMLLAVHAEMFGNACVLCVFWFCPAGFYCRNPHDVSCEQRSAALVYWCMCADFVRPADRMIKAQSNSYARVWSCLCVSWSFEAGSTVMDAGAQWPEVRCTRTRLNCVQNFGTFRSRRPNAAIYSHIRQGGTLKGPLSFHSHK